MSRLVWHNTRWLFLTKITSKWNCGEWDWVWYVNNLRNTGGGGVGGEKLMYLKESDMVEWYMQGKHILMYDWTEYKLEAI